MKFLFSCKQPAESALIDLHTKVKDELANGADLYLGLVPFPDGIGQMVVDGGGIYEYRLLPGSDLEAFNKRLSHFISTGWFPHMGVTVWGGYFYQWLARARSDEEA